VVPMATPTVTPAPAPVATPTVTPAPPPPPPPPPKLGSTVNASVSDGIVLVAVPEGAAAGRARASAALKFMPLTAARQLPLGSTFDTTRGTVRLTLAGKKAGTTEQGDFRGARFKTAQSTRDGLTTLTVTGGSRAACGAKRVLYSQAKGRFRTRGRSSWATGRRATWTQSDSCKGTLTVVKAGRVVVRVFSKRRDVIVRKGKRHLARLARR
jgi:hypothetical protein